MAKIPRRNISQRSEMVYDAHTFGVILDTREIFVGPPASDDVGTACIDHAVCHQFLRNLSVLNSMGNDTILVHMATCGGDWNYGIAMYDAIKNSCEDEALSDIVVLSHAHARSMSSVIPQAATYRVLMPNADYLVHYGELGVGGNYTNTIAEAEWAKKLTEVMLEIYAKRIQEGQFFQREGMDFKQTLQWLRETINNKQEFYMTAREAVNKGFADAVLGDEGYETISKLREEEE